MVTTDGVGILYTELDSVAGRSQGYKIYCNNTCRIVSVTRDNVMETTSLCRIFDSSYNLLVSANYSGGVATFNLPIILGNYYFIENYIDTGQRAVYSNWYSGGYPINRTNINYVFCSKKGINRGSAYGYSILSVTTDVYVPPPTDPTGLIVTPTYAYPTSTLSATGSGSSGDEYHYEFYDMTTSTTLEAYSETNTYVLSESLREHTIRVSTKGYTSGTYSVNAYSTDVLVYSPKQKLNFGTGSVDIVWGP